MPIILKYRDEEFLRLHAHAAVAGQPALGAHKIIFEFPVGVSASEGEQVTLLTLAGRLDADGYALGWLAPDVRAALSTAKTHIDAKLPMAILLRAKQIEALVRSAWPPRLNLALVGIANGAKGTAEVFGYGPMETSAEDWARALADCGYADSINVWVQIPRGSDAKLRDAGATIARAQADARDPQKAQDAVGKCRIALESAGVTGSGLRVEIGAPPKRHEDLTFEERLSLLSLALHRFTSPAHHSNPPDYGPAEARLALAVTAALIAYRVEKREHSL